MERQRRRDIGVPVHSESCMLRCAVRYAETSNLTKGLFSLTLSAHNE